MRGLRGTTTLAISPLEQNPNRMSDHPPLAPVLRVQPIASTQEEHPCQAPSARTPRVLATRPREGLPRLCRSRRDGQVAAAERLYLQRPSLRADRRRHLQDVVPQLHDRQQPFLRRGVSRTRARRTRALCRPLRRPQPAGRDGGDGRTSLVGTEINITQAGIPDLILPEARYLGWQESLRNMARLIEPEIAE